MSAAFPSEPDVPPSATGPGLRAVDDWLGEGEDEDEQHNEKGERLPPGRTPERSQRYGLSGPRGR